MGSLFLLALFPALLVGMAINSHNYDGDRGTDAFTAYWTTGSSALKLSDFDPTADETMTGGTGEGALSIGFVTTEAKDNFLNIAAVTDFDPGTDTLVIDDVPANAVSSVVDRDAGAAVLVKGADAFRLQGVAANEVTLDRITVKYAATS